MCVYVCKGLVRNSRAADWLGQMPVPPPPDPPPGGLAAGPRVRGGGWRCQTGRGRGAGAGRRALGAGPGALRASRAAAPPPGPYAALSSTPALSGCSLSSHSTFHAAASLPRERQPRDRCVRPRASHLARSLDSAPRARLAHGHTFVSPLAPSALGGGGGGGRTARGHTVAAAAGWPAGHGGRWGRRADETATHPGNQQGEGAAGGGLPWPRGRGARQTKAGGAAAVAVVATPSGAPGAPLTAPRPARLSIPFVWRPGARVRGVGGGEPRRPESGRPAARRARIFATRILGAAGARHPGSPAGLGLPPGDADPLSPFCFQCSSPNFRASSPARGLGSGHRGAGVQRSPLESSSSSSLRGGAGSTCL